MGRKRRRLEETARILRARLAQWESRPVSEIDRPIQEVAIAAVRSSLTDVGRQLSRLSAVA